jgi:fumarylacetoacetase
MSTSPQRAIDPTMDPGLRSWLPSAHEAGTGLPLQNLPLGVAVNRDEEMFVCVGVGDCAVDLDMLIHANALGDGDVIDRAHEALHIGQTNLLMQDPALWPQLRERVQGWLLDQAPGGQQARRLREKACTPLSEVELIEPCVIGNYTDFYASVHHASTVGAMFRPDNPLLPNYKHVPIGYHGRASTIVASGAPVRRPMGQTKPEGSDAPVFGPCKRLDYELELGCIIAGHNEMGTSVPIDRAHERIFGLVLVNDWSARDVQAWEYQPLGPFLAKNFATTISPWIVTRQVIEACRVAGPARAAGDPAPLPYLTPTSAQAQGWGLDITVEAYVRSAKMRQAGAPSFKLSAGNARDLFWTFPQMIAHHASNGCALLPGDLLASGTISGASPDSRGCLLELTWQGNGPDGKPLPRKPITLPTGETRTFLEDGDEVELRGYIEAQGLGRIALGACAGIIEAAP